MNYSTGQTRPGDKGATHDWVLRLPWPGSRAVKAEPLLSREWLVANGLGGYASGTLAGVASRRYHSLLIAALPAPLGRYVMLNHLTEMVRLRDGSTVLIGGEERVGGALELHGVEHLREFRLDLGLPVWRYEVCGVVLEKRVFLPHVQNTVHVHYRMLAGDGPVRLKLRPAVHFRPQEAPVNGKHPGDYTLTAVGPRYELSVGPPLPPLRLYLHGQRPAFTLDGKHLHDILYRV